MTRYSLLKKAEAAQRDEALAAALYRSLASTYRSKSLQTKFLRISDMERAHALFWSSFLKGRGNSLPEEPSKMKVLLYTLPLRLMGLGLALRMLERNERGAVYNYSEILNEPDLGEDEAKVVRSILEEEYIHEQELASEESEEFVKHLRDAILGMNDGLVESLSVTTGLAGAYSNSLQVAFSGLVVSIAGAISMGISTYAGVRAQKQVHQGLLERIGIAAKYLAPLFRNSVGKRMMRKGFSKEVSDVVSEASVRDPKLLSRVISEEEYGLREESLSNPRTAGVYSGLANMLGASFPLLPYFLGLPIPFAIPLSLVIVSVCLAATGFIVAVSADMPIKRKIAEMVSVGLCAAGASFIVGRLASVFLGSRTEL